MAYAVTLQLSKGRRFYFQAGSRGEMLQYGELYQRLCEDSPETALHIHILDPVKFHNHLRHISGDPNDPNLQEIERWWLGFQQLKSE